MSRPNARDRGYTTRWDKARRTFLRERPWCVMCEAEGRLTVATVVDHSEPHRGDQTKFWDKSNWQGLCQPHHNSTKQRTECRGYSDALGADGYPTDPRHPFNQVLA